MFKKFFSYENELCFKIPLKDYIKLLNNKTLFSFRCVNIKQAWLDSERFDKNVVKKSRIRVWKDVNPQNIKHGIDLNKSVIEYTTKFYFDKFRIELNSDLTPDEFTLLTTAVYNNVEFEEKNRFFLMDSNSNIYTADIFVDKPDDIRLEIEFENASKRNEYIVPEWLMSIAKKED